MIRGDELAVTLILEPANAPTIAVTVALVTTEERPLYLEKQQMGNVHIRIKN